MDPTWMPVIVALIGGIFSVLGVVVTVLLNKYVKDDQMRKVLETALQNGLGVLQQAAKDGIQITTDPKVEAQLPPSVSPQMTVAVQYVMDHADKSVKRFDLQPVMIAQKLMARAGVQELQTGLVAETPTLPAHEVRTLMAVRKHRG
jgi:hypothetical protein